MIPITSVRFGQEEEDLVLGVLRSGSIAQGPMVKRFEEEFASMFGHKHAIAVNNGTTALVAALEVLDLQPGDEVITTPFTFVATLNAILEAGASVTFADIREDDFNLDPDSVASRIGEHTRVIMPVHLYGQMADMAPLEKLAAVHDLRILEDSAQSHGATYSGRPAGSYGIGTFSFYATKNITTGEGGMIVTDDDALADRLRILRNQGMRERYVYEVAGHNYRLTDLQAAIAIPQLARYESTVATRQSTADRLIAGLGDVPGLIVPRQLDGRSHVWHQFTIRVTEDAPLDRDEFVARLHEAGVGAGVYYPKLLFDYDAYRDHPRVAQSEVPVARKLAGQVVSLPVHNALSEDDISTIISVVTDVMSGRS
ncbi:DegT/DnrJ/EryC1/StrS family aminotransferase [Lacisediminihabitans profunda]|uniref:DegT/DnrJ/EryC1/StrS family aminotransferase n=1 Tax=Lacisediminihabitans profunda TaxID=2594790 RepID=A0A5C8UJ67_9MICO|nr:DegT/DnrJ/EryC1/StrS family aminotransferase [Lacisediminihabitans profunda]TXN28239.1 DegT/DnrJ/EryC1/StrS family aminotransferase [Lacisediminihabitans profunda]